MDAARQGQLGVLGLDRPGRRQQQHAQRRRSVPARQGADELGREPGSQAHQPGCGGVDGALHQLVAVACRTQVHARTLQRRAPGGVAGVGEIEQEGGIHDLERRAGRLDDWKRLHGPCRVISGMALAWVRAWCNEAPPVRCTRPAGRRSEPSRSGSSRCLAASALAGSQSLSPASAACAPGHPPRPSSRRRAPASSEPLSFHSTG